MEMNILQKRIKTIHFVGIGGIGMSGIAGILHHLGYKIQGSDINENLNTSRLEKLGIKIFYEHTPNNIRGAEYLVISSAIPKDNPELQEALQSKIPVIKRSEMLAELMRMKTAIAISGSHGKTTTTSLVATLFETSGLKPTVINGGILSDKLTNAYIGQSDYIITEADESDATFINIPATIAVITNIDTEHLDYYKNFENLIHAFRSFILKLPFYGFAVVCIDDKNVEQILKEISQRKILTYSIQNNKAHVQAFNIRKTEYGSIYNVRVNLPNMPGEITIENIKLNIHGVHNVLNSLAAVTIGFNLHFSAKSIQEGFCNFSGVKRRFTTIKKYKNIILIDDYAHHPKEIQATINTAKDIVLQKGKGKITVVFQPHRFSRLNSLFEEFIESLSLADYIYCTDVYAAGEKAQKLDSRDLIREINARSTKDIAEFLGDYRDIEMLIKNNRITEGLIIFMGAGSISNWGYNIASSL